MPAPLEDPAITAAIRAARRAQALIAAAGRDPDRLQVRAKRPNDFVTQVDLASEAAIVEVLLGAFPDHSVRGEESQQAHGRPGADHVWIVDPLDGTRNFMQGYPAYSVSIALCVRGVVEHGVVLDVAHDTLFQASRGQGAWSGGRRLAVSTRSRLDEALVGTSCPIRPGPEQPREVARFCAVMGASGGIRRSGSSALDMAWVASGVCDAFFDAGLNAWDVAAGGLLVTEAGGRVGNFAGSADFLEARECMAANPLLFEQLATVLGPFGKTQHAAAGSRPQNEKNPEVTL